MESRRVEEKLFLLPQHTLFLEKRSYKLSPQENNASYICENTTVLDIVT